MILFYVASVALVVLVLFSGDSVDSKITEKIILICFIVAFVIYNIVADVKSFKQADHESIVHNTVCVLRYNAEKATFPLAVDVSYPQNSDYFPAYRNQVWQSIPMFLLVPGDIIDVTNREVPAWSKKLSENSYRIYPRKGVIVNRQGQEKKQDQSHVPLSPSTKITIDEKPVLCVVQQAPILLLNQKEKAGVSDVEKTRTVLLIAYVVFFVIMAFVAFASDEKVEYLAIICIPTVVMLSETMLWQLRKAALNSLEKAEDGEARKQEDDSEESEHYDSDSSDSSSFWARPVENEDDVVSDFYLPVANTPIRSMSLDAPEQLAMLTGIVFPRFHPSFFMNSIFIDNFIVFTSTVEIVDAKNSTGQVPDLESPDLQKYSAQLGPLTFASLAGKLDMTVFEPFILEIPYSKWPKIDRTLTLFGLTQHNEEEFDARRIVSVYDKENHDIANAYIVHRSTECSIIAKGSPEIILEMCSKYWNGHEVKDINNEFKEQLRSSIANATKINDGIAVAFSQGMVDSEFMIDKQVVSPDKIPNEVKNLTLLGVAILANRVSPGCEEFQETLASMGIRLAIFSHLRPRESLDAIGKMGLSTDFNCVIDLDDNAPQDIYQKLDTLNTHMPVGIKQLIEYVDKYDSIPLTIPLYLHPSEESIQSVLTMRESKNQRIGIVTDPLSADGVAFASTYPCIAYDSVSKRSNEGEYAASVSIRAINEITAMPSIIHLSEGTPIELVGDILKDSRNEEIHLRQSLTSYFFSSLFVVISSVANVLVSSEMFVFLIAVIVLLVLSFLIMCSPHDAKLLKRHRIGGLLSVNLIVMNSVIDVISVACLLVWSVIRREEKQKWHATLMFLVVGVVSVSLSNAHTMKAGVLSKNIPLIVASSAAIIVALLLHVIVGVCTDSFDWLALVLSIVAFVGSIITDFVSKYFHSKAEEDKQILAELDFTTRLGAFSPERR